MQGLSIADVCAMQISDLAVWVRGLDEPGVAPLLESLHPAKLLPSTDAVPERFELGTLPYELLAGVTAAVDFIAGLDPAGGGDRRADVVASMSAVEAYEDVLLERLHGTVDAEQTVYDKAGHIRDSHLVLRVPVTRFTGAMHRVEALGKVVHSSSTGKDVTTEVIDVQQRLKTLRISLHIRLR